MNFSNLIYLHALWLIIPFVLLSFYREKRAQRFAAGIRRDERSLLSIERGSGRGLRIFKYLLQLCGIMMLALALSGPRWGLKEQLVEKRGIDIVVAIDLSKSMLAADILPSRIERAKMELAAFIDSRRGDRVGIVAFAGTAIVACPLTMDYGAAKNFLKGLDAGMISSPGTDLASAIEVSAGLMKGYAGRQKVIVLLTDGEDTIGDPGKAARDASAEDVSLYVLGFGTSGGAPIPVYKGQSKVADYKKDSAGNTVISRIDAALMKEVASVGGGLSFVGASAVSELAKELETKEKSLISSRLFRLMEERFQYPLFVALLFFISELFITPVRRA